jgi:hypothetical protein
MLREDAVPIVNQVTVGIVEANNVPQLLQGPISARVRRNINPHQSATTMLDNHENIQQSEGRGDRNEEVARRWSPRGLPAGDFGMYFRTVRGETPIPNLTSHSLAMRSSPQSGFSVAIRRIRARSSSGIGGRPSLHFHRQKIRQPSRS